MSASRVLVILLSVLCVSALAVFSGPSAQQPTDPALIPIASGFVVDHPWSTDLETENIATQLRNYLKTAAGADDPCTVGPRVATIAGKTLLPAEALKITPLHCPRIRPGQDFFKGAKYAGAETCKDCHAEQYDDWRKTWHSKMEAWPTAANVVGDFNEREITYRDIKVTTKPNTECTISPTVLASRVGDKFYMTLIDKDDATKNVRYEIAKVLGGKWDQHYEVKIDGRYYPTPLRWSVKAGDWLKCDYRPTDWFKCNGTKDGTPKRPPTGNAAEAKCAGCHTTGYEFKKVSGLWLATGNGEISVACENCHGPASKHIEEAKAAKARGEKDLPNSTIAHPLKDLTALQQNQVCGQCHGRASNKQFPEEVNFQIGFSVGDLDITDHYNFWSYSGFSDKDKTQYFWGNDWAKRNRQQWQDFTKSAHYNLAGMSCLTCHTFHGKWEGPQLRLKAEDICTTCHTRNGQAAMPNKEMYAGSEMEQKGVTCINCHMPKIGWRSGATAKDPHHQWDTSSHTFLMASPSLEKSVGLRNACADCHMGNDPNKGNPYTLDELDKTMCITKAFTRDYLERLNARVVALNQTIDGLPPSNQPTVKACIEKALANIAKVDQNVSFVSLDKSFGFHNKNKSRDLLRYADDWLGEAERWVRTLNCP